MNKWISVNDEKPEFMKKVFLLCKFDEREKKYFRPILFGELLDPRISKDNLMENDFAFYDQERNVSHIVEKDRIHVNGYFYFGKITHWMSLPEYPDE